MTNPSSSLASGDLVSDSMTRIATAASKQRKLVIVGAVILIAGALAASLYLSKRNSFRGQAAEALFRARAKLDGEMKAIGESMKPATPVAKGDPKGKTAKPAAPVAAPAIDFAKFDVDIKLKEGTTALAKVAEDYPGTLAGFDAQMQLGSLYFDHGEGAGGYDKALTYFDAAAAAAPSNEQAIAALYNLGYTQEALNRCADAVKSFDRALNSGSGPFLGELLRGKARCQETLGDKAGAKNTYENMIKQLPGSEYAKIAEAKKASL